IRLYNFETGDTRLIENILGSAVLWSPNSKKILLRDVVIRHEQFVTQLFLYDIESESTIHLNPNDSVENSFAAWSPNGEMLAVVRRDLSTRGDQIWLMNADGSNIKVLTNDDDSLHSNVAWSPDGKFLLYDLYQLNEFPFISSIQIIEVETAKIHDLGIQGFNPQWMWK